MSVGGDLALALYATGMSPDAVHRGLKLSFCESSHNPTARGPSVPLCPSGGWGLFQFCDQNAEFAAINNNPDIKAQAEAFARASNMGTNLGPWTAGTECAGAKDAADAAVAEAGQKLPGDFGKAEPGLGPIGSDIGKALTEAFSAAVEALLGMPPAELAIRFLEVVGGVVLMGTAGVMLMEILSTPGTRAAGGIITRSSGKVVDVIPGGAVVKGAAKVTKVVK